MGEVAADGKNASRLFLETGSYQSGPSYGLVVWIFQRADIRGYAVEEPQVFRRVENAGEGLLDEMRAVAAGSQKPVDGRSIQPLPVIGDRGGRNDGREVQEVG